MSKAAGPTIFLVVTHGFAVRYLLQTEVLPTLTAGGARVVVLAPNADDGHLRAAIGGPAVAVERLESPSSKAYLQSSRLQLWLNTLSRYAADGRGDLTSLDDLWALHRAARPRATFKDRLRGRVFDALVTGLRASRLLRRGKVALETRRFPGHFHRELFARHRPDLVVTTSLGYFRDDGYLMREAWHHRVPRAAAILSWDNPTTWGLAGAPADWVLAQTETMRGELVTLHDLAPERVFVEGNPYFDHHFHPERLPGRAEFLASLGLDPGKRLLVLATQSPTIFHHNPELVTLLAQALADGRLPGDCQLWVRLHPLHHRYRDGRPVYAHLLKEYDRLKERFPFVHFNTPVSRGERLDADLPASELTLVAGLLHHAQVMVQHYSTIAVEGCLHDLPTINLGFEPGARLGKGGAPPISDWAARRSHNRRVVETGGVPVARDETELLALIRGYLADPRRDAAGRARVRANEGGAHPGRAGRAVGERLLELARRPHPAFRP